jgi:hypothetical protein
MRTYSQHRSRKKPEKSLTSQLLLYNMRHVTISSNWIMTAEESRMSAFPDTDTRYGEVLAARRVPRDQWRNDQKWVRFYLHFCQKYRHHPADSTSLQLFIGKLVPRPGQTHLIFSGTAESKLRYSPSPQPFWWRGPRWNHLSLVQHHTKRCPILGCCRYRISPHFRHRLGRPVERMRDFVPLGDALHARRLQVGFCSNVDDAPALPLETRAPVLHLVQPRTGHRREV